MEVNRLRFKRLNISLEIERIKVSVGQVDIGGGQPLRLK